MCGGCGATQEAKDQGRKYKALLDKWNRQPSQINKPQRTGWTKVNPNYRPCLWGSDPKDWCMSFRAHASFLFLLLLLFYLVCPTMVADCFSLLPSYCVCVAVLICCCFAVLYTLLGLFYFLLLRFYLVTCKPTLCCAVICCAVICCLLLL